MARQARGKSMDSTKVQVFHITQRCVRRAFLCGDDAVSGKSYDHRKQWIRDRLEFLASIFGIDVLTYTVMSNHIHHVLRSRPSRCPLRCLIASKRMLGSVRGGARGSTWGHPQTKSHLAQFDTVYFGPSGLISFLFFGYWFYNLLELVLSMMHELRCRKSLPECGLEAVQ